MTYRHEVRPGQTWRSKDKRDHGRTVLVRSVDQDPADYAVVKSGPKVYALRIRTLRTRYTLVEEAAR